MEGNKNVCHRSVSSLVGSVLLVSCGGDGKSDRFASEMAAGCIPVDGSLYKSEEPASRLGRTYEGDAHIILTFEGGMMRTGETTDEGSYECVNGECRIDFEMHDHSWRIELYDDGESLVTAVPWWTVPVAFVKQ